MAVTFGSVTVSLDIAFGDTYRTANGSKTWTDVSAYLRALVTETGRAHELDRTEAGTATFILDNSDRRFEPEYGAGAYSPDVKPMVPVRLQVDYSAVDYDVWFGFAEAWPQSYPGAGGFDSVVELRCVDGFKILAQTSIDFYEDAVAASAPILWYKLDETSGTTATDSGSAAINGTYSGGYTLDQTGPGEGGSKAVAFDGVDGRVSVTNPDQDWSNGLTIELWLNPDSVSVTAEEYFAVFEDNLGLNNQQGWCQYEDDIRFVRYPGGGNSQAFTAVSGQLAAGTWCHIAVTLDPSGEMRGYFNGVLDQSAVVTWAASTTSLSDLLIGSADWGVADFDGDLAEVAFYNRVLPAEDILGHYQTAFWARATGETFDTRIDDLLTTPVGWPSADRDLDTSSSTGTASEAQGDVLTVILDAADDDRGLFYQDGAGNMVFINRHQRTLAATAKTKNLTLGDGGGTERPYADIVIDYDDDTIVNRANVTGTGGVNVTASDSTSETSYGIRYHTESRHLNTANATYHAQLRIHQQKDPQQRISEVVVKPEADAANLYPQVLGRVLGDRINVKRVPPGGGAAIDFDAHIEGIRHEASADGQWVTTWQLSPASPWNFWIVQDATYGVLGTTTRAGY